MVCINTQALGEPRSIACCLLDSTTTVVVGPSMKADLHSQKRKNCTRKVATSRYANANVTL